MQKAVAKNLRDLCLTFQLDNALARIEFADIIKVALQAWRACENHERTSFDNRTVWAKFLDPLFIERHFPDRVKLQVVPELVRIYMSYLDGECDVERDLATMRAFLRDAGGCNDSFIEDLVVLYTDGPSNCRELATPASGGGLEPTAFTRSCGIAWLQLYGRRLAIYGKRKQERKNTVCWRAAKDGVFLAADLTRRFASTYATGQPTAYGLPASAFGTGVHQKIKKIQRMFDFLILCGRTDLGSLGSGSRGGGS